jgi:hypothetical protein
VLGLYKVREMAPYTSGIDVPDLERLCLLQPSPKETQMLVMKSDSRIREHTLFQMIGDVNADTLIHIGGLEKS